MDPKDNTLYSRLPEVRLKTIFHHVLTVKSFMWENTKQVRGNKGLTMGKECKVKTVRYKRDSGQENMRTTSHRLTKQPDSFQNQVIACKMTYLICWELMLRHENGSH